MLLQSAANQQQNPAKVVSDPKLGGVFAPLSLDEYAMPIWRFWDRERAGPSLPQTLQLIGDRGEGIDETGADQLHRSDCSYRNQRRDQRIFDCGNAALVLGQPANDPNVQLYLRAGWANVSVPHHHLRDKLDVAEFGGWRLANC